MKPFYLVLFILSFLHSSATPPTTPASNLHFSIIDGGYFNLGWTSGNGARRLIICKAGSPVSFLPQNGVDYVENTNFTSGQEVAPGEYVVYDNVFTSFYLTGLSPATQYFFAIFEYNGTGAGIEYLTSLFLTGSASTSATPTIQTSNASFSNITTNSVTISWTNGNGGRRLIIGREAAPVNADPVNNQPYNVNASFGSGATTGAGNYTLYNSSSTSTVITNLKPGTQYYFSFYEFNGVSQPQYKMPAYTTSVTTRSIPTIPSSGIVVTKEDGKELSLSWNNGNGQRRIIVARQGSNVTFQPANGTDYAENSVFGAGTQVAPGEYIVYDDNFNAAKISGLSPATTYYFKIFEYDGTGSSAIYLTSSFGSANATTAATPSSQASVLSASGITPSSLRLSWTSGSGRARLIVGRKNMAVNFIPQDFTAYNANSDFGLGDNLGNGQFVLSNTIDNFVTIHNLEPASVYHFAVFEYNGFNQPLYLSPAAAFSVSTLGALPVKLTRWEAIPVNNKVSLQWTTSSEINAAHFIVERSTDGHHFTSLLTLQAAGNSQSDVHYNTEDQNPIPGRSWYRLKIVDIDGQSEYSPIRTVVLSAQPLASLVRNPVQNTLEFIIPSINVNTKNEWQLINSRGQVINKGIITTYRTEINTSGLTGGSYWLRLNINNQLQTLPFVKY